MKDKKAPSINAIGTSAFSWGGLLDVTEESSDGTVTITTVDVEDGRTLTIKLIKAGVVEATHTATVSNNQAVVTIPTNTLRDLSDGQYTLTADVSDEAGNPAPTVTSSTFTVDTTAPTISSISVASSKTGNDKLAKAGEVITFTVTFSETVTLSNKSDVKVPFKIGGSTTTNHATQTTTTTANAIDFKYTVADGDTGDVALIAGPLTLSNSATVKDQ